MHGAAACIPCRTPPQKCCNIRCGERQEMSARRELHLFPVPISFAVHFLLIYFSMSCTFKMWFASGCFHPLRLYKVYSSCLLIHILWCNHSLISSCFSWSACTKYHKEESFDHCFSKTLIFRWPFGIGQLPNCLQQIMLKKILMLQCHNLTQFLEQEFRAIR